VDYVSLSRPARHNTGMPVYQLHQSSAPSADTTCPQSPHTVILWEYCWRWADALRVGRPGQQFVIRQGGLAFTWCRTVRPKSPKHFPEETRPLSVGGGGDTWVIIGVAANFVRHPSKVFQARQHGDEVVRFCVIHGRSIPHSPDAHISRTTAVCSP